MTFLLPFSPSLWYSLAVLLLTVSAVLTLSYLLGPENHLQPGSFLPANSFLIILGSWFAQGSWLDPKSLSSRIIFLVSFLCGVTIYTAYSAKLISFLSVVKVTLPFTSLEELLASGQYSVGLTKGTASLPLFFEAPPGSLYQRVASQLVAEQDLVASLDEGVARALNHKYVISAVCVSQHPGLTILLCPPFCIIAESSHSPLLLSLPHYI